MKIDLDDALMEKVVALCAQHKMGIRDFVEYCLRYQVAGAELDLFGNHDDNPNGLIPPRDPKDDE
jgi:hypothetical protein